LIRQHFQDKETIVTIIAEKEDFIKAAIDEIENKRKDIQKYIQKDNFFKVTFEPYQIKNKAPEIIKKMCDSSSKFNLGPMSTVAGIIAEYSLKAMIRKGAKNAIVDNGGDIALISDRTLTIGIHTGNKKTNKLAFEIPATNKILGICTSSGKIGHSFSFGNTDASIVISEDLALADAAATALGNSVKNKEDIQKSFKILENKKGIQGSIVFIDEKIGIWGEIPSLLQANIPDNKITRQVI